MKLAKWNIGVYYVFGLVNCGILWGVILMKYMREVCQLERTDVYFMESVCVAIAAVLQIPTGAFADKWGRANSVRIGMTFQVVHMILNAIATCPLHAWIANVLWAIGMSFTSGADTTLLNATLQYQLAAKLRKKDRRVNIESAQFKDEIKHRSRDIQGKSMAYKFLLIAVICPFVGHLATINLRLPLFIDVFITVTGLFVSTLFVEPPMIGNNEPKRSWRKKLESILTMITHPNMLWIVSFSVTIAVVSKIWFFTYNDYMELVNVPVERFGYVFALMNGIAFISSFNAGWISRRFSTRGTIIVIVAGIAAPITAMGLFVSPFMLSAMLFQNLIRGYMSTFSDQFMHQYITDNNHRATIASTRTAFSNVVEMTCIAMFAYVTAKTSVDKAILILGITMTCASVVLVKTYEKVFETSS